MRNNKAQALVEFVLLLPVIIMVLFIVIDFASVFYKKNHLEGILDDVVVMVENGFTKEEIVKSIDDPSINYTIKIGEKTATITLEQKIDFITPFSGSVFKNNFKINTKRVILYG